MQVCRGKGEASRVIKTCSGKKKVIRFRCAELVIASNGHVLLTACLRRNAENSIED
jgi:hypothetical protein